VKTPLRLFSSFVVVAASATLASAQLGVYLNAPRTSNSIFPTTTVENFDALTPGVNQETTYNSVIGTYAATPTNPFNIESGAFSWSFDGTTHFAVGVQSGTTNPAILNFASPQTYFGFGWAAGDNNNRMSFYNGATLIGTFSTADVNGILSGPTVTAINGSVYNSSDYLGQPANPTINTGENYAFINFIASGPTTFDRIEFYNTDVGSGFESDNHTILASGTALPDGTFVAVSSVGAPEPGSLALLGVSGLGVLIARRRRK
jgi:hypothetical protein